MSNDRTQRRSHTVIVAAVVAAIVLAGCGGGSKGSGDKAGAVTRSAAGFKAPNLVTGKPAISLADYRGKPVVLNFWASWCAPCSKEMPAMESVYAKVKDRVGFLGVDGSDSRRAALALVRSTGVTYPSVFDPDDTIYTDYKLIGRPTTLFIGADGKVLYKHQGELTATVLQQYIEKYFPRT